MALVRVGAAAGGAEAALRCVERQDRRPARLQVDRVPRAVEVVGGEAARREPDRRDAPYLDASSYYWSSQNPYQNQSSGQQVLSLASQVRASGSHWFAPFIAGYDKLLVGGTCIPRNGTETLDRVWALNAASHPDAWFGISWNEFVENTYLEPTVRYGTTYLDALRRLIFAPSP